MFGLRPAEWALTLSRRERAFALLWLLQRAREIQRATQAMGRPRLVSEDIQIKCSTDSLQFSAKFGAWQDVFDALTQQTDRIDPSDRS